MVGVSSRPDNFSRRLMRELIARNYKIFPVNPSIGEVEGIVCRAKITDVEDSPKRAMLMTSTEKLPSLAYDCVAADTRWVWILRSGGDRALRRKAVSILQENKLVVIDGWCPYLFLEGVEFPHRFHRKILSIFGALPY